MKKILTVIATAVVLISCRKDKLLLPECCLTTANLVGFYKIVDVKFQSGGSTLYSVFNNPTYFKQCRKDDVLFLGQNGNFFVDDKASVCNQTTNNYSGTWSLNDRTLITIGNIENENYTVENFNCLSMDLKITTPLPNTNTTYTYVYNLERL
jgi:hypothetical protein